MRVPAFSYGAEGVLLLLAGAREANLPPRPWLVFVASRRRCGYATGMKKAISFLDERYERAERLAGRTKKSDSGEAIDPFVSSTARHILERSEW
jgi:hypothetical protein